jgi:hypothetical protein
MEAGFGSGARIDDLNATSTAIELDESVDERVEGEVGALADPLARVETIADLSNEDVSGSHGFPTESLHTASLSVRVTSVSAGALSLFVCHEITSPHRALRWSVVRAKAEHVAEYGFTIQKQPADLVCLTAVRGTDDLESSAANLSF